MHHYPNKILGAFKPKKNKKLGSRLYSINPIRIDNCPERRLSSTIRLSSRYNQRLTKSNVEIETI